MQIDTDDGVGTRADDDYRAIGDAWAPIYDALTPPLDIRSPMIRFLVEMLSPGHRLLEFGAGTGRVALALTAAGFDVTGIEISPRMIDVLRSKPGAAAVRIIEGNFARVRSSEKFDAVVCVYNTLYSLLTQEEQLEALRRAEEYLLPGGRLVVEGFSPLQMRFHQNQAVVATDVSSSCASIAASVHSPAQQRITTQHVQFTGQGIQLLPVAIRYLWPSEIDCLGRLAGLELRSRWGSWDSAPFSDASSLHVAVYEKPMSARLTRADGRIPEPRFADGS
jgi:SAM-dependent methyltransferase